MSYDFDIWQPSGRMSLEEELEKLFRWEEAPEAVPLNAERLKELDSIRHTLQATCIGWTLHSGEDGFSLSSPSDGQAGSADISIEFFDGYFKGDIVVTYVDTTSGLARIGPALAALMQKHRFVCHDPQAESFPTLAEVAAMSEKFDATNAARMMANLQPSIWKRVADLFSRKKDR